MITAGILAASAIAGYYGNKSSSTSTPTLPAPAQSLQDQITAIYMKRLQSGSLPPGYQASGITGINSAYDGAATNENAILTARGLASSPVAAAVTSKLQTGRAGAIGSFNANLPLVQQQMELENLQGATGELNGQRGVSSTGTTGGGIGGALTGAAGIAGYIQQLRNQNKLTNPSFSGPGIGPGDPGYPYEDSFTSTTTGY